MPYFPAPDLWHSEFNKGLQVDLTCCNPPHQPQMTTKMKGLLKGLRYISQIFDPKEHEMQIGNPTDVKHVAHIGWDSPSVNPPSWMNEFRSAPLGTVGSEAMADELPTRLSHELNGSSRGSTQESPTPEAPTPEAPVPKPGRHASTGNGEAPTRTPGAPPRRRRNKSITDSVDGGGGSVASTPADSPAREGGPLIPKGGRKKKAKAAGTTNDGGSSRSAKSRAARAALSDGGVGQPYEGGSAENLPVVLSPRRGDEDL